MQWETETRVLYYYTHCSSQSTKHYKSHLQTAIIIINKKLGKGVKRTLWILTTVIKKLILACGGDACLIWTLKV